ncbi:MAG: VOC family protein [Burkholderiaceae bacterium]|nr:VOC family protein [Burkholderiaceae bacterium]
MPVVALDHVQLAMPEGAELQARNFYGSLLGLTELAKPEELAGRGGAWFQCGSIQVHLGVESGFRPAMKAHPAFLVEQFEELLARLQREGFKITEDTSLPAVRRAFTNDPFGNRIELVASDAAA